MTVTKINTHASDALKRLLEQYKGLENLEALINIYTKQIQDLEDALHPLFGLLSITDMVGAQLDNIGEIVGQSRPGGMLDPDYRNLLYIRIGQNTSNGDPEKILSVFKLLTESAWVQYINHEGGEFSLTGTASFPTQEAVNATFVGIRRAIAAGTRLNRFTCADETESFAFEGGSPDAPGLGFGSVTDGLLGGMFATTYEYELPFAFAGGNDLNVEGFGSIQDPLVGGVFTE